jgi:hypothetical protein
VMCGILPLLTERQPEEPTVRSDRTLPRLVASEREVVWLVNHSPATLRKGTVDCLPRSCLPRNLPESDTPVKKIGKLALTRKTPRLKNVNG